MGAYSILRNDLISIQIHFQFSDSGISYEHFSLRLKRATDWMEFSIKRARCHAIWLQISLIAERRPTLQHKTKEDGKKASQFEIDFHLPINGALRNRMCMNPWKRQTSERAYLCDSATDKIWMQNACIISVSTHLDLPSCGARNNTYVLLTIRCVPNMPYSSTANPFKWTPTDHLRN